ncbi:MAG TPA: hypothetical protein VMT22_15455, partial [Terriglobales bacterium]|nr:hypothetical protein [Terriglobales bacterium]
MLTLALAIFSFWGGFEFMSHHDAAPALQESEKGDAAERQSEHDINIESISLAEATSFAEIEYQANQLLDYISKISSFADRACDTAIRQCESAQLTENARQSEVSNLRADLEDTTAKLEEQRRALEGFESVKAAANEQIYELEARLQERESQLDEKENELKH